METFEEPGDENTAKLTSTGSDSAAFDLQEPEWAGPTAVDEEFEDIDHDHEL